MDMKIILLIRNIRMNLFICFLLFLFLFPFNKVGGQSRIIFRGEVNMVLKNSTIVVIANESPSAIMRTGDKLGGFVSEDETNRIRWKISDNTGVYEMPFKRPLNGDTIPFILQIGTAGSSNGYIDFASYGTTASDNLPLPSGISYLAGSQPGNDNSSKVIDRFWIVDASSYATKPSNVILTFGYSDDEHSRTGNLIAEANLKAHRWNSDLLIWNDYIPSGTVNTTTNKVSDVPANFYKTWTLLDDNFSLPITLLHFIANCRKNDRLIEWATASELNADYFLIERSYNAIHFETLTIIPASGISNTRIDYHYLDKHTKDNTVYYRLTEVDYDGKQTQYPMISSVCNSNSDDLISLIKIIDKEIHLEVNNAYGSKIMLFDIQGRLLYSNLISSNDEKVIVIRVNEINNAVYFLNIIASNGEYASRKLHIQ